MDAPVERQSRAFAVILELHEIRKVWRAGFEIDATFAVLAARLSTREGHPLAQMLRRSLDSLRSDFRQLDALMAESSTYEYQRVPADTPDVIAAFTSLALGGFAQAIEKLSLHPEEWVRQAAEFALTKSDSQAGRVELDLTTTDEALIALALDRPVAADLEVECIRLLTHDSASIRQLASTRIVLPPQTAAGQHALETGARIITPEWITAIASMPNDEVTTRALIDAFLRLSERRKESTPLTQSGYPVPVFELQSEIVKQLVRRAVPGTARRLIALVGDTRSAVEHEILSVLGSYELETEDVVNAYQSDQSFRQVGAGTVAELCGVEAIPLLCEALASPLLADRRDAQDALEKLGDMAVKPLTHLILDRSFHGRAEAITVLGRLGATSAIPAIAASIDESDLDVKRAAVRALGQLTTREAWEALQRAARSASAYVRGWAATALGHHADPETLDILIAIAEHDAQPGVRSRAVRALGRWCGQHDRDAGVELLLPAVLDPNTLVRRAALDVLPVFGQRVAALAASDKRLSRIVPSERKRRLLRRRLEPALAEIRSREFWSSVCACIAPPPPTTEVTQPVTEDVVFTLFAPNRLAPGEHAPLDVYVHSGIDPRWISRRVVREFGSVIRQKSKGPIPVESGATMTILVRVPSLGFEDTDIVYWQGTIGNAAYVVDVPQDARRGTHSGEVLVDVAGIRRARLRFILEVAESSPKRIDVTAAMEIVRSAFASYAHSDTQRVLARIQGMQAVVPDMDVFLDVLSIRSGENWIERIEEEIHGRDLFLLFWSEAAAQSDWVEREWRAALRLRGLDFIAPVPLDKPDKAPPPRELASRHFAHWSQYFQSE